MTEVASPTTTPPTPRDHDHRDQLIHIFEHVDGIASTRALCGASQRHGPTATVPCIVCESLAATWTG